MVKATCHLPLRYAVIPCAMMALEALAALVCRACRAGKHAVAVLPWSDWGMTGVACHLHFDGPNIRGSICFSNFVLHRHFPAFPCDPGRSPEILQHECGGMCSAAAAFRQDPHLQMHLVSYLQVARDPEYL